MTDENNTSNQDKLDDVAELVTELVSPSIPAKARSIIYIVSASLAGACGAGAAAAAPIALGSDSAALAITASVLGVIGGLAGAVAGVLAKVYVTPDAKVEKVTKP